MTVDINSSSPFAQFPAQYAYGNNQSVPVDKPVQKKKVSTTGKVMIGLGALAAVSIACIALKKYRNPKQFMNSVKKLNFEDFQRRCQSSLLTQHFGSEQITAKLAEIQKLPKAQQQQAMQALQDSLNHADIVRTYMNKTLNLPKGMTTLPEEIKVAYEKKDLFRTADLMRQKLEQIPDVRKLKNEGATVAETIKNTFGPNSSITPHTYDLSLENPVISVQRNMGGYKDGIVGKKGLYWNDNFTKVPDGNCAISAISSSGQQYARAISGKGFSVQDGVLNVDGAKRRVLRFCMEDPRCMDTNGNPTKLTFCLMSPTTQYTPAQKDLLKLAQNPNALDINVFDTIAAMPKNRTEIKELGDYLNLNYDLILSAIQSMAK